MADVSGKAVVEPGATLAEDARVGPFTYIGSEVEIGPGCVIDNNVTIAGRTCLGARNHVFPLAAIGVAPDGGEPGASLIGEGNALREHVTVYAGRTQPTRIGAENLIMIGSHVGSGASIGDHGIFANFTQIGAEACIEDYVRTSGFTSIEPWITVGAYSFTAGYAAIDQDAPPFAILQGSPYRVRGVNTLNLKRCGFAEEDIQSLKLAFRELFNGHDRRVNDAALKQLVADPQINSHVRRLIEALRRAATAKGTR